MHVQLFVKGIAGSEDGSDGITWPQGLALLRGEGLVSNWWRGRPAPLPRDAEPLLTPENLRRHLQDYANYGADSPFISLAAGSVERLVSANQVHSALNVALAFATKHWRRPGILFYGWTLVAPQPAVEAALVSEAVRDLLVYRDWLKYQTQGEITAKIRISSRQLERIEWWDGIKDPRAAARVETNPNYVDPVRLCGLRGFF